ncbi:hypothetical protein HPB49_014786 [Dermacentor silvarum]|uniref:Uncharacterized protein n=1 Tax=Dermacentor silvarum TaxID=543639 RepID=A0ACB8CFM5_DERSI|nr:hypothetical protein HPB49_014786 [Dermacentor silvarum]
MGRPQTILDHHTYLLNLTAANARPDVPPRWELEYSARAAYNLSSLEPQQWDALLLRMERDDDLFYRFFRYDTRTCNLVLEVNLRDHLHQASHGVNDIHVESYA